MFGKTCGVATRKSLRQAYSVDDVKRLAQKWIKQTPAAFFKNAIVDHVPRWQSELLVKETVFKIKINKSMDFTESVLAAICFCHVRR